MAHQGARILKAKSSLTELDENKSLRRLPRAPARTRSPAFMDRFEDRVLIYDAFWSKGQTRVLLVCPPPLNLEQQWRDAKISTCPGGDIVPHKLFVSRSSMIVELPHMPANSDSFTLELGGQEFVVPIQPDFAQEFSASNILFTMNKDNRLEWIEEWARFHHHVHQVNSVILFDNGSQTYRPEDIEKVLLGVAGLEKILVLNWPQKFGMRDSKVLMHPYWAHFLQNSSFSVVLRRFGARAAGLLNMDIDELAHPVPGGNVFSQLANSASGFHILEGQWVEAVLTQDSNSSIVRHSDFSYCLRDFRRNLNAKKWALDPRRDWLNDLNLQPSWHKIKHMPENLLKESSVGKYWHFKGISTNWKEQRNRLIAPRPLVHQKNRELGKMFDLYKSLCPSDKKQGG